MMGSGSDVSIFPARGLKEYLRAKARHRRERLTEERQAERGERPRNDLRPTLRVEDWPIDSVRANRHVRRAIKAQVKRIKRSIGEYGLVAPILVSSDGGIIDGVSRWQAARELGLPTIPVIVVEHLSPAQIKKLSITLNRTAELGEWDEQNLKAVVEELILLEEDLTTTGFTDGEIDTLLLDDIDCPSGRPDGMDERWTFETGERAVTLPGDVWRLNGHKLLCGDSCDPRAYQLLLGSERASLLFTDQPYNVPIAHFVTTRKHREFAQASGEMSAEEFARFTTRWMSAALACLLDGALLGTFIDWRGVHTVLAAGEALGLNLLNIIVWAKSNGALGSLWRSQHELLPMFKVGDAPHVNNVELGRYGRWRSNLWQYPGGGGNGDGDREAGRGHPTPKNRAMIEDAILDVTRRGDIVLDPFLGSGTTLIAAETTGRVCRAIEIDGLYCDLAIRRWQVLTGEDAVLAETGETFATVARRRKGDAPTAAAPVLMLPPPRRPGGRS
jgi:DNA modification methylase